MTAALPPADQAARRDRLRPLVEEAGADRLLVTAGVNVRYLSGFAGTNGQVLVGADRADDRLVTDGRYEARAATEAPGIEVVLSRDAVATAVELAGGERLGFEGAHLSWEVGERLRDRAAGAGVTAVATSGLVERLRTVKDVAEVARLERACALTVDALTWLLEEYVEVGRSEREIALALERRFVDLGADGPGFPSIVAGGLNGAIPHHAPTDRHLVAGDLLTVDCGALVDGYHADCTRTVAVGTAPTARLVEVHDVVRRAQAAARAAAVVGATGGDVDAAAREIVADAGLGDRFVHGTGHGVGLEIHEAPAVSKGSTATLREGTALTVEPGVYLPGVGGVRIEDTLLVTAEGPRPLTTASRELRVIEQRSHTEPKA